MKKTVKLTAVALVVVILTLCFASCAKTISGSYGGEINLGLVKYEVVYSFSGNNVTVTRQVKSIVGNTDPVTIEGTYEIVDGETGTQIKFTYKANDDVVKGGTFDFEEGDGFIKIAGIQYNKK